MNTIGHSKSQFLKEAILIKVIKFMLETLNIDDDAYDYLPQKEFTDLFEQIKNKQAVVDFYINRVVEITKMQMYKDIIQNILSVNTIGSKYNEILLNNFTIKGVYSLSNSKFEFNHETAENLITSAGLKYLGHLDKDDFKKY